jgi:hypothetical protein
MNPVEGPLRTALGTAELRFQTPPTLDELQRRLPSTQGMERREVEYLIGILTRDGKLPDRYPYPVQVWRFGDALTLIGLAGEPVVDYSLRFKAVFGWDKTWVTGYNNELLAYIPSLRILNEGGYEGTEGMWEYGLPAPFTPAVEETITSKVKELVSDLGRRTSAKLVAEPD